jgi:hypothetical protein
MKLQPYNEQGRVRRPLSRDLQTARLMARRIVAAGRDRVRNVFMIGSRALGRPTMGSDLDLVVIVELPQNELPWQGRESEVERNRIQKEIGLPPVATDMNVRTTDQFEEARSVVGGIERLVDLEGVSIYSRELDRPPDPRRDPSRVRHALVRAWLDASLRSMRCGIRLQAGKIGGDSLPFDLRLPARPAATRGRAELSLRRNEDAYSLTVTPTADLSQNVEYCWYRSMQQCLTALCVLHQIETSKQDDFAVVLRALDTPAPQQVRRIRGILGSRQLSESLTLEVIELVLSEMPHSFRSTGFLGTLPSEISRWKSALHCGR